MPNQLARETSPYLLQHAHNPVAWYPWGPEAHAKARQEDKPIFLSVGYSACHWCHVMERESFENESIARQLNEHFVSIKVDREERPDLDQIYMHAVQMLTGRGGWPLSVFLTPDLKPFYGGTYWPPTSRMGMPGFDRVLAAVAEAWQSRRGQAVEQAEQLTGHLRQIEPAPAAAELDLELLEAAERDLLRSFDPVHGGFGQAPKFPHPMALQLALRIGRRRPRSRLLELVQLTLDKMWRGGIYDHLGGGFARYSVDDRWLVPHFEKMLYDNALLADAYLDYYRVTGHADALRVVRDTLDYVLRDMTDPRGGFHSAEDADSEGEEGKFYVWTPRQIRETLGSEAADRFCYVYDVTEEGNFEGRNILHLAKSVEQCARAKGWDAGRLESELAASRATLRSVRDRRIRPGKDDKVLTDWNALMIHALARAGATLAEPRYVTAATRAAAFLLSELRPGDGRLLHAWRRGTARHNAYLDDYAFLVQALVTLYEASFDEHWIDEAVALADQMIDHFRDGDGGCFFFTADNHESLIMRSKILYDNPTPSGNAMAATGLLRLARLCGRSSYQEIAAEVLRRGVGTMRHSALAASQLLIALDGYRGPTFQVVVLGDADEPATSRALQSLRRRFIPNYVLACRDASPPASASAHLEPLFAGKVPGGQSSPTVYVCENDACQAPAVGVEEVERAWQRLAT